MFLQCFHNHKWRNRIQECCEEQNHPKEGEGERKTEIQKKKGEKE